MSQIFLSYSSRDRGLAVQVAAQLVERGLSVWYDDALQTGTAYRAAIRSAIDGAPVVCVLWTAAAARSAWVKDEAGTGNRRGSLFSVACGRVPVPAAFRRTVFGRIARPEHGPTSSEMASLARGLSHMMQAAGTEDRFSVRKLLSRTADYLATSAVFAILTTLLITLQANAPITSGPLVVAAIAAIVGLAMGGVGFASSRLFDYLATRYLGASMGPSLGRLIYRWCGEATGCAIPLVMALVFKGPAKLFSVGSANFGWHVLASIVLVWLLLMLALALKYALFAGCIRCRYLLLT